MGRPLERRYPDTKQTLAKHHICYIIIWMWMTNKAGCLKGQIHQRHTIADIKEEPERRW